MIRPLNKCKNILVRMPNWLGDMVMAYPFLVALRKKYPDAFIGVIAKSGLVDLVPILGNTNTIFPFDKNRDSGLKGAFRFGRQIKKDRHWDLFYCLPNSFSSAVMAFATGAGQRIGYQKEGRSFLLTTSKKIPGSITHRAKIYLELLGEPIVDLDINQLPFITSAFAGDDLQLPGGPNIVLNVNSVADSRRLPVTKAVEIIHALLTNPKVNIIFPGHRTERDYVAQIIQLIPDQKRLYNYAGKTTLPELVALLGQADQLITTDSGIAHLGNLTGIPTTVFFGAGDERQTAPIFTKNLKIISLPDLPCARCVSNTCKIKTLDCMEFEVESFK